VRVFLDTNVLVSAFATRGLCADVLETVTVAHQLVVGRTVLAELARALRVKVKVPSAQCEEMVNFVRSEAATVVDAAEAVDSPVEQDDRQVLGEAQAGGAEVFVTGDAAVVALRKLGDMRIVTPREFWEELRQQ